VIDQVLQLLGVAIVAAVAVVAFFGVGYYPNCGVMVLICE